MKASRPSHRAVYSRYQQDIFLTGERGLFIWRDGGESGTVTAMNRGVFVILCRGEAVVSLILRVHVCCGSV